MKKNFFLSLISIVLTLFLIEIILSFFIKKQDINFQRYLLYDEGKVFKNINDKIFKFHPNKEILTENFYRINDIFLKESSYILKTNNFGLVQSNDIDNEIPSILFLGDSFTQGQGDYSWINKFDGKYKDLQVINGGIMGTSPYQFMLMENHISEKYNIKKIVILYLGEDLRREYFIHNEQRLKCLEFHKNCIGNESYYGFPLNQNPEKFLNYLYDYRKNNLNTKKDFKQIRRNVKKWFSNLIIIKYPKNFLKNKFYESQNVKIQKNFEALNYLNDKYKNDTIFIQLRTKNEILNNTKIYETIYAEKYIKKINKNHFVCDFNNDIDLFYKYDGHPNKYGYEYMFNCVKEILDKNL